jgi:hypothetical protein
MARPAHPVSNDVSASSPLFCERWHCHIFSKSDAGWCSLKEHSCHGGNNCHDGKMTTENRLMPRQGTSDKNAENAVTQFNSRMASQGRNLDHSWLTISELLMTCEIWSAGEWRPFLGQPVLRESNDYKKNRSGGPNKALKEATLIGDYLAERLDVPRDELCSHIGGFLKELGIQPNNPRAHAFRSLVAKTLSAYGDTDLTVREEVDAHSLYPGFTFALRSENPRIDIVVLRQHRIVALCSTRWSYRHDRVDMLKEAAAYMAAARGENPDCKFFGITAEVNPARLKKVVKQTSPVQRNAAMERLIHLHKPIATTVIGHNGLLNHLMDLAEWVRDSANWK